jgi:hypothetical protein
MCASQATQQTAHRSLKHSNRLCTSRLPGAASRVSSSTATGCVKQTTWSCLTRVAQAQQQAMYQQDNSDCLTRVAQAQQRAMCRRLPWTASHGSSTATGYVPAGYPELPTGRSNTAAGLYGYLGCLTRVAQAQQQICQQATLSCLHTVSSSTATGYGTTGYLELPHTGRQAQQRANVPAGYLRLPHTVAQAQQWLYQQATLGCLTRVAQKHSNR